MARKWLILVVDDQPLNLRLVRATLLAYGYDVITAEDGQEALRRLESERPDLVVLDLNMPVMDGFDTMRRMRAKNQIPIIMLTVRVTDVDKLKGFQAGADDYITKPFNPDELAARVAAVLRQVERASSPWSNVVLHYPDLDVDLGRRRVMIHDNEVMLSGTEWAVLEQLASNVGQVVPYRDLLSRIWGPEFQDETHLVRTCVRRLRAKLQPRQGDPLITSIPGKGYRLVPPPG